MSQWLDTTPNLVSNYHCREKRKRALLASNPPRDIPASDAPKACQALAGNSRARALFLALTLGHRSDA